MTECKTHPDAPHGFMRNASHNEDRYVCECEYWEPPQKFQLGDTVRKTKGSQWHGKVVGTYSTTLTPEGYAVESKYPNETRHQTALRYIKTHEAQKSRFLRQAMQEAKP